MYRIFPPMSKKTNWKSQENFNLSKTWRTEVIANNTNQIEGISLIALSPVFGHWSWRMQVQVPSRGGGTMWQWTEWTQLKSYRRVSWNGDWEPCFKNTGSCDRIARNLQFTFWKSVCGRNKCQVGSWNQWRWFMHGHDECKWESSLWVSFVLLSMSILGLAIHGFNYLVISLNSNLQICRTRRLKNNRMNQ